MNVVKEIKRINEQELKMGIKKSWHDDYKDSAYIFVGNIDHRLTEGDIRTVFEQYGKVVDINRVTDKKTGEPKGFAFIGYEDQRSTVLAVDNFNETQLLGRTLRVDHVRKYKPPKEEEEEEEEDEKAKEKKEKKKRKKEKKELKKAKARKAEEENPEEEEQPLSFGNPVKMKTTTKSKQSTSEDIEPRDSKEREPEEKKEKESGREQRGSERKRSRDDRRDKGERRHGERRERESEDRDSKRRKEK